MKQTLKEKVVERLKGVVDPETGFDVMTMGLIRDLEINDYIVSLTFRPSSSLCPLGFKLALMIKEAIRRIPEVRKIRIKAIDFIHADQLNRFLEEDAV